MLHRLKLGTSLLFLIIILLSASCTDKDYRGNHKLLIVTTTGMIADAVKNITGDSAKVIPLMGPGVDPHLYKATHGDLQKLMQADLIIYNGLHLEGKMAEVLHKLSGQKKVVAVSDGLSAEKLIRSDEFDGTFDPHIWFDVSIWSKSLNHIALEIQKLDPANAGFYQSNTITYQKELEILDAWIKSEISSIPEPQRLLVTAHDAFGYFGRAYNIEVRGLQGLSTATDFGLNDITQLVNLLISRNIKAIFVESSVSPKAIDAVIQGANKKGHQVVNGGTLYSDAMGEEGSPEGTYIGMVRANVSTIMEGLK